jgi:hypothetical protein
MRELSVIELDLIVGGYGESGGGDTGSFDESAYESIATTEADGSYNLVVSESEYMMQSQAAATDGWTFEGTYSDGPNGRTVTVKATYSS